MGISEFQNYDLTYEYQDRQLQLWGQPCTVFLPKSYREVGYENQTESELEEKTGVSGVGNHFVRVNTKCFINFNPKKGVFYHFNWFPEDQDELCTATFPKNSVIKEDAYIRTAQVDHVSKWGDLILKVVHIEDEGIYKTLRRTYFLRPESSTELVNLLVLGETGEI